MWHSVVVLPVAKVVPVVIRCVGFAIGLRTYESLWLCGQPVFLVPVLFDIIQRGVVVVEFDGRDGQCDDEEN